MAHVSFVCEMRNGAEFQRVTDHEVTADERTYALFTHLTLLALHFIPVPVIGPLIMWQIKKDQSPFLDDHGKEAVNFQISLVIYAIGAAILGAITCTVGWVLFAPIYILGLVGMVLAAIAANRGQYYRYPACLRLVS